MTKDGVLKFLTHLGHDPITLSANYEFVPRTQKKWDSKQFSTPRAAAQWALDENAKGAVVYFGINQMKSGLSTKGRREDVAQLSAASWLDFDAETVIRPATDVERAPVRAAADECRLYIESLKLGKPLLISSGNGYQTLLFLNVPLTLNDDTHDEVEDVLQRLDFHLRTKFAAAGVKLDSMINIDRVFALPGTRKNKLKGIDAYTEERPNREVRVFDYGVGADWESVKKFALTLPLPTKEETEEDKVDFNLIPIDTKEPVPPHIEKILTEDFSKGAFAFAANLLSNGRSQDETFSMIVYMYQGHPKPDKRARAQELAALAITAALKDPLVIEHLNANAQIAKWREQGRLKAPEVPTDDLKPEPTKVELGGELLDEAADEIEVSRISNEYVIIITEEDIARLQNKPLTWAIDILKKHVVLPSDTNYIEILLFSAQHNLRSVLPPEGLLYLIINGDFSSAKTYLMKIVLRLGRGIELTGTTEPLFRRTLLANPQRLIGIDELDDMLRNSRFIEAPLKHGNIWSAPWTFLEAHGRSWEPVTANVGGPKVLTGAETSSPATISRGLEIKMERHIDTRLINLKMWGSPEVDDVTKWLEMQTTVALRDWTREKVKAYCDSGLFDSELKRLTQEYDIPRGIEIIHILMTLGKILGWDITSVLTKAQSNQTTTTTTTETFIELVSEIYKDGTSVLGKNVDNTDDPRAIWRRGEKGWEILSLTLLGFLNDRLKTLAGPQAVISPQRWQHVIREMGWTKSARGNWTKERRRLAWHNRWFLVFDRKMLSRLGVD